MILQEIEVAQQNEDQEAFMFYFEEYIKIQRLNIDEAWKKYDSSIRSQPNKKQMQLCLE